MPRSARLDAPGVLHHVMIRGIERGKIFKDDTDRHNLLERLAVLLSETQTECYAWALIPNHAHFLFRSGPFGLPTLMRRLLTGYAVTFNHRHQRHGQLFQNRYKSIICQEDVYLKELVRYIHLNPLRAKLVSRFEMLGRYRYCGHGVLLGKWKQPWQNTDYVLGFFGTTLRSSRNNYRAYVEKGIEEGRREDLTGGGLVRSLGGWKAVKKARGQSGGRIKGDERILGDSDFVEGILSEAGESFNRHYDLRRRGYNFKKVIDRVGEIMGVEPSYILSKGRQKLRVEARSLLCYWAVRELGLTVTEMARRIEMTPSAVGYAVVRGEKISKQEDLKIIDA